MTTFKRIKPHTPLAALLLVAAGGCPTLAEEPVVPEENSQDSSKTELEVDSELTLTTGTNSDTGASTEYESVSVAEETNDVSPEDLQRGCPPDTRIGGFEVELGDGFSAVSGRLADSIVPASIPIEAGTSGSCTLLKRENPFCDPSCTSGFVCDFDGSCIAEPSAIGVGTIDVSGLVNEVSMEPVGVGFNYFNTDLPEDGYEAGAKIKLSAAGDATEAFTLYGFGVQRLSGVPDDPVLSVGQPLDVTWDADGGGAQVLIEVNIDQHGNSPLRLECHSEDTGSFSIPAELVTQLIESGISGFPTLFVTRQTADTIEVDELDPGCVDFRVFSSELVVPEVEGHTPCKSADECPDGQMCDTMNETCI